MLMTRRPHGTVPLATVSTMRRGEIRLVDLDPTRGSEANKRRPAVIVSNDRANAAVLRFGRGVVTVVPITSTLARVSPFQVRLAAERTGLSMDSKAQAEQITSLAAERVGQLVGQLQPAELTQLDDAIRLHLQL